MGRGKRGGKGKRTPSPPRPRQSPPRPRPRRTPPRPRTASLANTVGQLCINHGGRSAASSRPMPLAAFLAGGTGRCVNSGSRPAPRAPRSPRVQHSTYRGIPLNHVRNALTASGWNARYPNTNALMTYLHSRLPTYRAHGNPTARTINAARNVLREYLRRRLSGASGRTGNIRRQQRGHQAEIARLIAAILRINGANTIHQPFYRWRTYNVGTNVTANNLLNIATKNAIRQGLGL